MSYRVPDCDSSSTSSKLSFNSAQEVSIHNYTDSNQMTEQNIPVPEIQMENSSIPNSFDNLSDQVKAELMAILQERTNLNAPNPPSNTPVYTNSFPPAPITRSALPNWNGRAEDFSFYITRLEARIKREWAPYVDPGSICLDMIDTLPEENSK